MTYRPDSDVVEFFELAERLAGALNDIQEEFMREFRPRNNALLSKLLREANSSLRDLLPGVRKYVQGFRLQDDPEQPGSPRLRLLPTNEGGIALLAIVQYIRWKGAQHERSG